MIHVMFGGFSHHFFVSKRGQEAGLRREKRNYRCGQFQRRESRVTIRRSPRV